MTASKKLLIFAALFLPLALVADLYDTITTGLYLEAALFLILVLLDAVRLWLTPSPQVEREIEKNLAVQTWNPVNLKFVNESTHQIKMMVFDLLGEHTQSQLLPQSLNLSANSQANVRYQIKATRRGNTVLKCVDCLLESPWGLWHLRRSINCESQVRVQPNYKNVFEFALLGDEQKLARMGNRQQRRRGEGTALVITSEKARFETETGAQPWLNHLRRDDQPM